MTSLTTLERLENERLPREINLIPSEVQRLGDAATSVEQGQTECFPERIRFLFHDRKRRIPLRPIQIWETIQQRKRRTGNVSVSSRTKSPIKNARQPKEEVAARSVERLYIQPMLLQLVAKLPEGEHWQYEVKWDRYRGIAVIHEGDAQLWSRNERELGKRFPTSRPTQGGCSRTLPPKS